MEWNQFDLDNKYEKKFYDFFSDLLKTLITQELSLNNSFSSSFSMKFLKKSELIMDNSLLLYIQKEMLISSKLQNKFYYHLDDYLANFYLHFEAFNEYVNAFEISIIRQKRNNKT